MKQVLDIDENMKKELSNLLRNMFDFYRTYSILFENLQQPAANSIVANLSRLPTICEGNFSLFHGIINVELCLNVREILIRRYSSLEKLSFEEEFKNKDWTILDEE